MGPQSMSMGMMNPIVFVSCLYRFYGIFVRITLVLRLYTFCIHYYSPELNAMERSKEPSKLNSEYNPDYLEYLNLTEYF